MAKAKSALAISNDGGVSVIGGAEPHMTDEQLRYERTLNRRLSSSGSAINSFKTRLAEIKLLLTKPLPDDTRKHAEFYKSFYELTQEQAFILEKMAIAKAVQRKTQTQLDFVYEQIAKEENPDVNLVEAYARMLPDAPAKQKQLPKKGGGK